MSIRGRAVAFMRITAPRRLSAVSSASAARSSAVLGGLLSTRSTCGGISSFGHQPLPPARQQNHRRGRRGRFDGGGDFAPVHVRHPQVGDHDRERFARCCAATKCIDARLPAVGSDDVMAVACQRVAQRFDQERIIVHDEDAQGAGRAAAGPADGPAIPRPEQPMGRRRRMVVPLPGSLSISISALWRCTIP